MKNTCKKVVPMYTVNLDDIETLDDIRMVFALAKQDACLPLTDEELMDIVDWAIDTVGPKMYIVRCECDCPKKQPWYKRFWNWMKKPFTKKK